MSSEVVAESTEKATMGITIELRTEDGVTHKKEIAFPPSEYVVWIEEYHDRVEVQYDAQGNRRKFADIDQENLKRFYLVAKNGAIIKVPFNPEKMELRMFFHNQVSYSTDGTTAKRRYPVVGYVDKETGQEHKVSILENGQICIGLDY